MSDEKAKGDYARQISEYHGLNRSPKDYAIEFGEYMAKAVDYFFSVSDAQPVSRSEHLDAIVDARRALLSAAYEFRKRAQRAKETA